MPQHSIKWPPIAQIIAALIIIGLMVAILFPVFQKPFVGNHNDGCHWHLKQLGLAMIQYTQDADENFPSGVNSFGNGWAGQLYPFIKSTEVYRCPEDLHDGKFISYAENLNLTGQSFAVLEKPASTIALYEFSTLNCDPSTPEAVSATGLSAPQDSTRHDPNAFGLNFLMTDGHIKRLLPAQVSGGPGAVSPKFLPSGKVVRTFAVK